MFLSALIGTMPFLFTFETGDLFFLVIFLGLFFLCHGCEGNTITGFIPTIVVFPTVALLTLG